MTMKRAYLWTMVVFLALSALIAIWALLSGEFGDTQERVVLTTLTISFASICAMACAAFVEKRGLVLVGGAGVATAALAALVTIVAIWAEFDNSFWRATASAIVIAIAYAHALLLFIPTLAKGYRWSQSAAAVTLAVLTAMLVRMFWSDGLGDGFYRLMGVDAVLVVLFSLLVPLCARLGASTESAKLTLYPDAEPGIYRDRSGHAYRVTRTPH